MGGTLGGDDLGAIPPGSTRALLAVDDADGVSLEIAGAASREDDCCGRVLFATCASAGPRADSLVSSRCCVSFSKLSRGGTMSSIAVLPTVNNFWETPWNRLADGALSGCRTMLTGFVSCVVAASAAVPAFGLSFASAASFISTSSVDALVFDMILARNVSLKVANSL